MLEKISLTVEDGTVYCSSLQIAEYFEKEHKIVLRSIDNLIEMDGELDRHDFVPMSYPDSYGRSQRGFLMTRDGFMFLAMGFTGEAAYKIKKLIIAEYNRMESEIRQARELLAHVGPTLSPLEMMRNQLDLMIQQEKEIKALQSRVTQYEDVISKVKEDLDRISPDSEFFTVMAYCKSIGKPVDSNKAKNYGSQCSRLSRNKGMHIGEVPHERWKTVNTYHISILKEVIK